jgi:hypothetical protein
VIVEKRHRIVAFVVSILVIVLASVYIPRYGLLVNAVSGVVFGALSYRVSRPHFKKVIGDRRPCVHQSSMGPPGALLLFFGTVLTAVGVGHCLSGEGLHSRAPVALVVLLGTLLSIALALGTYMVFVERHERRATPTHVGD